MVISRYLCILPCVVVIFTIFPYSVNVIKNARENVRISMQHIQAANIPEYGALFNFDHCFHNTLIIFVPLIAHFSRLLDSFPQNISDSYRVLCTSLLDSAQMIFLRIYIYMKPLQ